MVITTDSNNSVNSKIFQQVLLFLFMVVVIRLIKPTQAPQVICQDQDNIITVVINNTSQIQVVYRAGELIYHQSIQGIRCQYQVGVGIKHINRIFMRMIMIMGMRIPKWNHKQMTIMNFKRLCSLVLWEVELESNLLQDNPPVVTMTYKRVKKK